MASRIDGLRAIYLNGTLTPSPDASHTTFMAWNLMHLAAILRDAGGIPAEGNLPDEWQQGSRWGFLNPAYR